MTEVTAAIIRNEKNEILICQRGPGGSCARLWEFPGGKREPNEDLKACLVRECREELNVEIGIDRFFFETVYAYPEKTVRLFFFLARILKGEPELKVHADMVWEKPERFSAYPFCPADAPILERLMRSGQS
ncbi:MAG TPA: (deoxy)nucleoside triphosphate pyrophosphohydrolase [Feifaniaceae bacterium]|nr:(deoxy)nucleoside triphosphate pyrophosphohydrolase [Feifaniaceae bacterium]